ncbi:S-adenosyl-L-methionine-dependent methyltransferase [Gorgonomyces haynaldii]|nr:S-adenosyl-L-methionine-dependent methyltransferase [Gorgonomyces haynaldii]
MSVNKYIKSCLVHPLGGYYTARDVFGTKGDFTTSPEISQMFGEMIGIFFVNAWKKQSFSMLELGPGRGTLLQDVLRTMQQFKMTPKTVHLVEQSPFLREMQRKRWDITDNKNPQGTVFEWHDTIDTVPKETFMVLSHEFFDALPVFKFERTEKGWRELLVDQDDDQESPYHFKLVRSPVPTQTQEALKSQLAGDKSRIEISPETQFHTREISAKMDKESIWLNVDYGQDGPSEDSLRVFQLTRGHQRSQVCQSIQ